MNFVNNLMGKVIIRYWDVFLLQGLKYTLQLSVIAVFFGTVFGSLLAMTKMSKFGPVRWFAGAYTEIIRGTPILLQLYLFYFMLPSWLPMLKLSNFTCIAVALVVNSSAYVSEVVRSGIQAVDPGQMEAARCLGMNRRQAMIKIIMPQAVKNILPALGNEFIMMIKETSLASTFFIGDIMSAFRIVQGATYLVIEPLIFAGLIYFVLTLILSNAVNAFERRMQVGD